MTDHEFIKANRLNMSMLDMAKEIDMSYAAIRKYMIKNNLQVDHTTMVAIRNKKMGNQPRKATPANNKSPYRLP